MRITHRVVEGGKVRLGDLISLGRRFIFYTTHPDLSDLDGENFACEADVVARIERVMPEDRVTITG
ncbi:MAG: hypothetical protein V3R98_07700 [Alphaproteobacteria bacterium]